MPADIPMQHNTSSSALVMPGVYCFVRPKEDNSVFLQDVKKPKAKTTGSSIVLQRDDYRIALQRMGYTIAPNNGELIIEYLIAHSDLLPHLAEMPQQIAKYFDNAQLKLDLYIDTEENYTILNVLIGNTLPAEEAFEKERTFYKNYFRDIYKATKGKLNMREVSI